MVAAVPGYVVSPRACKAPASAVQVQLLPPPPEIPRWGTRRLLRFCPRIPTGRGTAFRTPTVRVRIAPRARCPVGHRRVWSADVRELAYLTGREPVVWEFESPHPHGWCGRTKHVSDQTVVTPSGPVPAPARKVHAAPVRPRGAVGQRVGVRSRRSQVRSLPRTPAERHPAGSWTRCDNPWLGGESVAWNRGEGRRCDACRVDCGRSRSGRGTGL